jgi:hypothetical protein
MTVPGNDLPAVATARLAGIAVQRDQELTEFYDRHSAMGLGRIRQLLNDMLVRRRHADTRRRRHITDTTGAGSTSEVSAHANAASELSESESERLGVIDHSRHVSSLGRR